jgi:hypothetical protein
MLKIFIDQMKSDPDLENNSAIYGGASLMIEENQNQNQSPKQQRSNLNEKLKPNTNTTALNRMHIYSNINRGQRKSNATFNDIPQEVLIEHLLFFLDINSLPKFSLANKKTNESVKTHIFIRLHFLNKEKKIIEQEHSAAIKSIEDKRKNFFEDYELDTPNKDHAVQLMQSISNKVLLINQ